MAAVIVPRNDEIFKIRGAGVAAGRDLQAGIAPCADDGERQAERGDIQNANVALAVDLAFRHGQLRIQHIIRDKCLLFPLSSGRLGKTFLPGQVGCQAFKYKLGSVACGCIAAEVIGREQQRGEKEQQPQNRAKRSAFNHDHFSFSRACPKSEAAGPPQQAPGPATREAPSAEVSDAQVYWSE